MQINPSIFREYDIRGTVGKDLSEEFAYLLGRAYGSLARDNNMDDIAIGYDCRLSSESYAKALARGISDEGLHTIITGEGPTPQLYFAVFEKNLGGGIQVTGSHNPSDMNGFKICLGTQTLSGPEIQNLKTRVEWAIKTKPSKPNSGKIDNDPQLRQKYINFLIENSKPHIGKRKLKVVVDAGNGVGGLVGPIVLKALGVEVIELFCDPDGRFPNHHPDPTVPENLIDLIATVRKTGADLGIGWDGDADRIGAVDENGEIIFGDMLTLLFAREVLKDVPNATIVADVKCSSRLFDDINAKGGNAVMWKTGHSLIKSKLRELKAELAGEMSGHIFFKHRYFGYDDALYSSVRLIEIMSKTKGTFSSLLSDLTPMVSTPEIRVDCPEQVKFKIAESAKELFPEYKVSTIDGVRVQFENGWGLVRASNTQPVLVMRFEANTPANLEKYQTLMKERIEQAKQRLS